MGTPASEELARKARRIFDRDERVVAAMSLAATFGEEEEPPEVVNGRRLTRLERQVAKDARLPKRFAPMYLEAASRRFENRQKIEANRPSALAPMNTVLLIVQREVSDGHYKVLDIAPDNRVLPVVGPTESK